MDGITFGESLKGLTQALVSDRRRHRRKDTRLSQYWLQLTSASIMSQPRFQLALVIGAKI